MLEFMTILAIFVGFLGVIYLFRSFLNRFLNKAPIVSIENGKIQGRIGYSRDGKHYFEYLGIPYAEPPLEHLRFEPPAPLSQNWTDVKQTTKYPPMCLQFDLLMTGKLQGSEDCLYLNVFTHDIAPKVKKPVLVFIHGGGFISGSSKMYRPTYFMDEDVVLVTLNYRLGPLGFLSTGDHLIPGNMGLKDQNFALRWIQRNIENFGGDNSKVTIFGESAGAASVHFHILSPLSKGLFQRAIAQSGAATCPWVLERDPREITLNYVKKLGCPTNNMKDLVGFLKKMDAGKLVEHQKSAMIPTNPFLIFTPCIEAVVNDNTFLSQHPSLLLKAGNFANVPFMLGVNSGEGGLRTAKFDAMPEFIETIDICWQETAHITLIYNDLKNYPELVQNIKELYFGNTRFKENIPEFKKKFTILNSDAMFFEPIKKAAVSHAKHASPTYLYFYDYESFSMAGVYSIFRAIRHDDWIPALVKFLWTIVVDLVKRNCVGGDGYPEYGITHASDLFQAWNTDGLSAPFMSSRDTKFSKKFVRSIADFAKNKNPLTFDGVIWPSVESENQPNSNQPSHLKYMKIGEVSKVIDEPFAERMPFWDTVRKKCQS